MTTSQLTKAIQHRSTILILAISGGIIGVGSAATWHHRSHLTPNLFSALIVAWAVVVFAIQRKRGVQTLQQRHNQLKVEVAERTATLSEANGSLQREIADRETVENEVWRSNMELQQFAYVAAHDLKQPLRTATLFLELLDKELSTELDPKSQEYFGYALSSIRRMTLLVNDLLALAKVNADKGTPERLNIHVVLNEASSNLYATIQASGTKVTHDDLPSVFGDRRQLVQLFQNLLDNAVKYGNRHSPTVHIGVDSSNHEFRFSVHDNGIGIKSKDTEAIFELFHRLVGDSQAPGSGIGLSLCRRIVNNHGGRIWAESQPGSGSTFYFTLPKMPEANGDDDLGTASTSSHVLQAPSSPPSEPLRCGVNSR